MSQLQEFVVVTGMTGAGRGTAAKVLEKLGYYVIDNIPPDVLGAAVHTVAGTDDIDRLAVVVDARSRGFFIGLSDALEELRRQGSLAHLVPRGLRRRAGPPAGSGAPSASPQPRGSV